MYSCLCSGTTYVCRMPHTCRETHRLPLRSEKRQSPTEADKYAQERTRYYTYVRCTVVHASRQTGHRGRGIDSRERDRERNEQRRHIKNYYIPKQTLYYICVVLLHRALQYRFRFIADRGLFPIAVKRHIPMLSISSIPVQIFQLESGYWSFTWFSRKNYQKFYSIDVHMNAVFRSVLINLAARRI